MTENIENLRTRLKAALDDTAETQLVDQLIEAAREQGRQWGDQAGYSRGLADGPTYVGEPGFPAGYNPWDL